ncbi:MULTISPECIES: sulfite exporter TauE/SafE family protein [unclassified Pseudomonas]|uniref:sulfite exporter TauE/SafE family protein n=1 Tax=unclassified Pseudomonas TaxID=196821 RepID=UPI0021BB6845|nr:MULTISPECIES: sulfite exporter TauE/SafE family protein [unclassified Pseudomonas]MCT8162937.1 sulfite exporter TauE/SafE family protein [Pseudomonas sp. HD6422]MCT8181631.1 sulfite exporter TauE/SafE family protein [Pseudomonas sp. HD6421]
MLAQLSFTSLDWLIIALAIGAAYIVFGIAGFGTALVAGPVLIHFMPLSRVIPLLVLLDFVAAFGNLLPSRRDVVRDELLRLLPCMAVGCAVGVMFLLRLKTDVLLLSLGLFVTAYAVYALAVTVRPARLAGYWAVPIGVVGGLFGAMFGSGGFLYAIYLSARLQVKEQVRATQSALISSSTLVRLSLFLFAGVYADSDLLLLAAWLLPVMFAGLWIGRRVASKLSREAFVRLVTWLVLASGLALLGRYLSG